MNMTLAILLVTSLTCVGLLGGWASTSGRHWFLRTSVFVGAGALLLLIPAYEPFVAFVLQGAVVAVGVQLARWWRRRQDANFASPDRPRFSLITLLSVMVFVAIASAVGARLPALNFRVGQSVVLIGLTAGWATLVGLWMVHGRLVRWWLRLMVGLALTLMVSLPLVWYDRLLPSFAGYSGWPSDDALVASLGYPVAELEPIWIPIIVGVAWIVASVLSLIAGLSVTTLFRWNSRAKRVLARGMLLLLAIVLTVPLADVYYRLMTPLPIPKAALPDPNGYDDFVAAGEMAKNWKFNNTAYGYDTAPVEELAAAVKEMEPAYERLVVGLAKETRAPVDYFSDLSFEISVLQSNRSLVRAGRTRSVCATRRPNRRRG